MIIIDDVKIEVTFNFIYVMRYNGLVICLHFFNYQHGT
jgi:hypothetical protein